MFGAGSAGAAIAGAALAGAASSAVSGAVYGNFDWDDVLKGAFTGALTAGLNRIAAPLNNTALGSVGTQIGTQGIVTEVLGGDFADGALNGLLSGVSSEMLNNMNAAINSSGISGVERLAALQSARLVSSAVRIAGMDGHPGQLFAQELITGLVEHASEGARDAAYELGLSGGQSARDFFQSIALSGGSGGGEIIEVPASSRLIATDDELRSQIENYEVQFRAELNNEIYNVESSIVDLNILIESADYEHVRQLYISQREPLLSDLDYLQQIAADPDAAIVSLMAASESRNQTDINLLSEVGHFGLDIIGLLPIVGEAADGLNAVWYASEGRNLDAALSSMGMIPGIGVGATIGRWASRVRPVNNRIPINSRYAGTTIPLEDLPPNIRAAYPHSVSFTGSGFPDFSRYSINNVRIELGATRQTDFARADRAAGFSRSNPRPHGYTWHHHQDAGYMQLVPTDLHDAIRHTGGIATSQ